MAYFECITGSASSGDGVALIVECDSNFAGSVITADNGEDIFTETCPSVSPYTVRFEGIPTGTYTISGVSQGQTFTTQFTVLDYETTLNATPEGATVLPINDIQIWLHCANIWNKNYTTLNQVLADSSTLLALISSNNAADYMVRSTTWANAVTANSTAMGYIGNNNYCANKLLNNSTWLTAICNSTYFESVLNVKVPTMTSNTTPSGECFSSALFGGANNAYAAFDDNANSFANPVATTGGWVGYKFTQNVSIKKVMVQGRNNSYSIKAFKIQSSNDGNTYVDKGNGQLVNPRDTKQYFNLPLSTTKANYWRVYYTSNSGGNNTEITEIQFYGRA